MYKFRIISGAIGGDGEDKKEGEEGEGGIDPEIEAARREAEEKRQEKHRQMEAEREEMRQTIRDKVCDKARRRLSLGVYIIVSTYLSKYPASHIWFD